MIWPGMVPWSLHGLEVTEAASPIALVWADVMGIIIVHQIDDECAQTSSMKRDEVILSPAATAFLFSVTRELQSSQMTR